MLCFPQAGLAYRFEFIAVAACDGPTQIAIYAIGFCKIFRDKLTGKAGCSPYNDIERWFGHGKLLVYSVHHFS